jgi:ribosome biogenesis protein ENP2
MGAFFLPTIGTAPSWIPFLDTLTEEMEEKVTTQESEDYKFLTKNDLEQISATHLIGTNVLKSYMHGYFMAMKLYQKLLLVADPFAYEKH